MSTGWLSRSWPCPWPAGLRRAARSRRRTGGDPRRAMLAAAAAPLLTGAMIRTHFDLAPVVWCAGLCWRDRRAARARVRAAGAGTAMKLFPAVAVPVAAAWLWGRGERRQAVRACPCSVRRWCAVAVGPRSVRRPASSTRSSTTWTARSRSRAPGAGAARAGRARARRRPTLVNVSAQRPRAFRGGRRGWSSSPRCCACRGRSSRSRRARRGAAARSCSPRSGRWRRSPRSARCCRRSSSSGGAARGARVRVADAPARRASSPRRPCSRWWSSRRATSTSSRASRSRWPWWLSEALLLVTVALVWRECSSSPRSSRSAGRNQLR